MSALKCHGCGIPMHRDGACRECDPGYPFTPVPAVAPRRGHSLTPPHAGYRSDFRPDGRPLMRIVDSHHEPEADPVIDLRDGATRPDVARVRALQGAQRVRQAQEAQRELRARDAQRIREARVTAARVREVQQAQRSALGLGGAPGPAPAVPPMGRPVGLSAYPPPPPPPPVYATSVYDPPVYDPSVYDPSVYDPSVYDPSVYDPSVYDLGADDYGSGYDGPVADFAPPTPGEVPVGYEFGTVAYPESVWTPPTAAHAAVPVLDPVTVRPTDPFTASPTVLDRRPTAIAVRQLSKTFGEGDLVVSAVRDVDFSVRRGEVVLIMGPSGSGKTTLLLMLGAMLRPSTGTVVVGGTTISEVSEKRLPKVRAEHLGFIFQDFNLLAALSARENVELACNLAGVRGRKATVRAEELLTRVGLGHRLTFAPEKLSGGEKQRVAIARALANDPPLLLADEPTANLDSAHGRSIGQLLRRLADEDGRTSLIVTHDERLVEIADRVLWLEDGILHGETHA